MYNRCVSNKIGVDMNIIIRNASDTLDGIQVLTKLKPTKQIEIGTMTDDIVSVASRIANSYPASAVILDRLWIDKYPMELLWLGEALCDNNLTPIIETDRDIDGFLIELGKECATKVADIDIVDVVPTADIYLSMGITVLQFFIKNNCYIKTKDVIVKLLGERECEEDESEVDETESQTTC